MWRRCNFMNRVYCGKRYGLAEYGTGFLIGFALGYFAATVIYGIFAINIIFAFVAGVVMSKVYVNILIEKAWERHEQNMDFSSEESEWLTREEVCDMLHITYTTLWRKENEGVIKKHKMGRRNLYSKKEVESLFKLVAESANI